MSEIFQISSTKLGSPPSFSAQLHLSHVLQFTPAADCLQVLRLGGRSYWQSDEMTAHLNELAVPVCAGCSVVVEEAE